ncbi:nucleus protein [Rhizoctonia solani AG-1 IA]|uniref:Nucleus protein n=1 Tax=Thanatephorus cucumeris (strain AG1-IA) TaxID=983506 RepID=L8WKW0_THACA|nr:nucleus protein [Rhizoctonia solani AG-1 IA]
MDQLMTGPPKLQLAKAWTRNQGAQSEPPESGRQPPSRAARYVQDSQKPRCNTAMACIPLQLMRAIHKSADRNVLLTSNRTVERSHQFVRTYNRSTHIIQDPTQRSAATLGGLSAGVASLVTKYRPVNVHHHWLLPDQAERTLEPGSSIGIEQCRHKTEEMYRPVKMMTIFSAESKEATQRSAESRGRAMSVVAKKVSIYTPISDGENLRTLLAYPPGPGLQCDVMGISIDAHIIAAHGSRRYVEAAKKRGPPKGCVAPLNSIQSHPLLTPVTQICRKLRKSTGENGASASASESHHHGADFTQSLGQHLTREQWEAQRGGKPASRPKPTQPDAPSGNVLSGTRGTSTVISATETAKEEDLISSDEESNLVNGMQKLAVTTFERRFHGKSSGLMLVKAARSLKQEYVNAENPDNGQSQQSRRPEFWRANPWEWIDTEDPLWKDKVQPPPDDLRDALIDLFFKHVNAFFPLLHRPLFESNIRDGLHFKDSAFACVLLLVCAVGSRWSDDHRVFLEQDEPLQHSAGWKYFEQVQFLRRSLLTPPKLFDLQIMAVSAHAARSQVGVHWLSSSLSCSSKGQAPHTLRGQLPVLEFVLPKTSARIAEKCIVEAKAQLRTNSGREHFGKPYDLTSSALGRPCAIQDEDSDVGFPVEVDDEYWPHVQTDPTFVPAQPAGVPPRVAFFNCYLKLIQILGFALRTIYSINKSKILLGFVGPQWEQHIVAELDSALNKWIDSVPDHLRWDPNRENSLFFDQSATLYSTYYHVQILIHRPFIPSPRKPSPLSFPSLAICTTAARSCSHVLDLQRRRSQTILPGVMVAAFTSGIVLLINVWGQKKSGGTADPNGQIKDVHKCMDVLKNNEHRWHSAGRFGFVLGWGSPCSEDGLYVLALCIVPRNSLGPDILYELASFGDLPLPQPSPKESNKREREAESTTSPSVGHTSSASEHTPSPGGSASTGYHSRDRPIAKPRSVLNKASQQQQQQHQLSQQQQQQQQHYDQQPTSYTQQTLPTPPTFGVANLPVNTAELGSMHHLPPDFMYEQQNNPLHGIWNEQSHDPLVSLFGTAGPAQGQGYAAGAEASAGVGYYAAPQQSQQVQQPQTRQGYPAAAAGGYMGEQQHSGFVPGMAAQPYVGGALDMWQQGEFGRRLLINRVCRMDDWGAMLSQDMLAAGQPMDPRVASPHGPHGQHGMPPGASQM